MFEKILILTFFSSIGFASIFDCSQLSPNTSEFFERKVVIECDLDIEAKPKLLILSGSSRVPLKTKAVYVGKESGDLYERLQLTTHDGVTFGISVAANMFIEGPRGGFLTYEPHAKSAFWDCYNRD